ncbi:MAG: hypothetical protein COA78_11930 [Blastopirellula sp.]|nr:MAG: hypothetical protein COA78_11930 [Blastopirellula sp.]
MSKTTKDDAKKIVSQFVGSCDRDYEFPSGGYIEFLTETESELQILLGKSCLSNSEKISVLSDGLNWSDCYSIVIFGVRLAVLATRLSKPDIYKSGILALAAGGSKIDWRDLLGVFAIFEYCSICLSLDFQSEIQRVANLSNEEKLHSSLDSYYSRSTEMRSLDVLGFEKIGVGDSLNFKPKQVF